MLSKLKVVHFSGSETVLDEEREHLVKEYTDLINGLMVEKETISRQIEKEAVFSAPLRKKSLKEGYCYFCDISISSEIPYRLTNEEQSVLQIEVVEGAKFCSQDCLLG